MEIVSRKKSDSKGQEKGSVLFELAVAVPFLVLLFLNVVAFGKALSQYIATLQVARDSAQVGARTIGLQPGQTDCVHDDGSACGGVGMAHYLMHHRARSHLALVNEALTDVSSESIYDDTTQTVTMTIHGNLRTMFFNLQIPISVTAMQPYLLGSAGIPVSAQNVADMQDVWVNGGSTTVAGRKVGDLSS